MTALLTARRDGRWPAELNWHAGHDEALALQLAVLDELTMSGERLAGWKVGLTTSNSRDRMGVDFRPFGYILDSRILMSGAVLDEDAAAGLKIEAELCLTMGAPLTGPVDRDGARQAVRSVRPSFELNQSRCPKSAGDALKLADGLGQWGIVVGPESAVPDTVGDLEITLHADDEIVGRGSGADMDDPFLSLARLSALLGQHGRSLLPDQHVITGGLVAAPVAGPAAWRADFGRFGEVQLDIHARAQDGQFIRDSQPLRQK